METPLWKRVAAAATTAMLTLSLVPAPAIAQTAAAGEAEMGVEGQAPAKQAPAEELAPLQEPVATVEPVETVAAQSDELATEAAPAAEEGEPGLEAQATPRYEQEVNDTKEQANSVALNTFIRGSKSKDGDEDWFAINVPAYQTYRLSFNSETAGADYKYWDVELYDYQANRLVDKLVSSTSLVSESQEVTLPAGTAYVRITSYDDLPVGTQYRLSLSRQGASPADDNPLGGCRRIGDSEGESNDGRPTANLASLNTFVRGTKSKEGDADFFVFQVPSEGNYTLSFNGETAGADYKYWGVALYDHQANRLVDRWVSSTSLVRESQEVTLPAGTAYVRITSYDEVPVGTQYRLSLSRQGASPADDNPLGGCRRIGGNEVEENEAKASANLASLSTFVHGQKDSKSDRYDVDWYVFQVPTEAKYTLSFNGETTGIDYKYWGVALYDYQANRLVDRWVSSTSLERESWEVTLPAGTAYVRITSYDEVPVGTKYRLSLDFSSYLKTFPDVPKGFWGYDVVHRAASIGIVNGYNDGNFGPNDKVTRGQAAVMLYNLSGRQGSTTGAKRFPDVSSNEYYYTAVCWANVNGVINGYRNGNFGPDDPITREQLATMIANYAGKFAKKNVSGSASDYASMRDAGSVSDYARKSVGWCFRNKILSGTKDGRVNPKGNATRAETAKMMLGLYNQLG